ncbi:MAG TPA: hypothetical protein VIV60_02515, partial [Polyangiaceae bacterium]
MPRLLNDLPRKLWQPVLTAARARFVPNNGYGVFAFGIGPLIRNGLRAPPMVLNVYVRRKLTEPRKAVEKLVFEAGRVSWCTTPNVIATGRKARASSGGPPQYSGLHAGAVVTTRGATHGRGALACLLGTGGDPTHALTAGHLFPSGALGSSVFAAAAPNATSHSVGTLVANFLDQDGVDGAVIALNAAGKRLVRQGGPLLSDYLPERSVWGKLTCAFLPSANDFSRQAETEETGLDVHLSAPTRGVFVVKNAVQTDGELTHPGDSGTVLCSGAANELAVGVCSGSTGLHSVFEPFARVFGLACAQVN